MLKGKLEVIKSFYADDLLLYISEPATFMPHLLFLLNQFGHISGYKLNLDKSELFPLNEAACNYSFTSLPFKVSEITLHT